MREDEGRIGAGLRAGAYLVFFATSLFLAAFCGLLLFGALEGAASCARGVSACDGWTRATPLMILAGWLLMQIALIGVLRVVRGWMAR